MESNSIFFTARMDLDYNCMTTFKVHVFCKSTGFIILLPHTDKNLVSTKSALCHKTPNTVKTLKTTLYSGCDITSVN